MEHLSQSKIPIEQIQNGALILLLLRECSTWEELCGRYAYANPAQLTTNTATIMLRDKLFEMRDLGLLRFADEETAEGKRPSGPIAATDVEAKVRVAFGGISLSEAAMISRHARGYGGSTGVRPAAPAREEDRRISANAVQSKDGEGLYESH